MERYYNENPQVTLWREKAFKVTTLFCCIDIQQKFTMKGL